MPNSLGKNIIVTSPPGPYFLRAIDHDGKNIDPTFSFEVLKDAFKEACLSNVVHVITNVAMICKAT
jgi:hypothetical protein